MLDLPDVSYAAVDRHFAPMRRTASVIVCVALVAACTSLTTEPEARQIRIATGSPSGVYYPVGAALANAINETIPGVKAVAEATGASIFNVEALEQGTAEFGLALANVAYTAFRQGTIEHGQPHGMLRGIAVMYVNVLQIVTLAEGDIRSISDLRRGRIGYGMAVVPEAAPARIATVDLIAAAYNLSPEDIRADRMPFGVMTQRLRAGSLEAGIVLAGFPFPAVTALAKERSIRLIGLDRDAADGIRSRYPFYKPAVIPAGTYPGQEKEVTSVGVDNLLLCREDLDEQLVYEVTKALFEALPREVEAGGYIDPDLGAATPIPLHPGAARYYRARELLH